MTPLISYAATIAVGSLTLNSGWCPVILPELGANTFANGATPPQSGAAALAGPIYRAIYGVKGKLVSAAGITAGALEIITLGPDGNWHISSAALTVSAATSYYFALGQGVPTGSFTMSDYVPVLGIAFLVSTAFLTAGITYMEMIGTMQLIDPSMWKVVTPLKL